MNPRSTLYGDDLTVREGRQRYFDANGFGPETYTAFWAKIPLGPVPLFLPNPPARKAALPFHDVDHVLTGYPTDWPGECQIAAFELGTGCGRFWFGWLVNSQAFLMGALRWPRRTFKAFVRGKRCERNIFQRQSVDDALLDMRLGDLRAQIGLDHDVGRVGTKEHVAYALTIGMAAIANIAPLGALAMWWLLS